jgi:4-hydroxybenzoate polyprenyltransferase
MGQGNDVKISYTFSEKLAGFVDITRPILSIMGSLGIAAAAGLAYGGVPVWNQCLIGVIVAFLAVGGIHAFNDFVDARRDTECWPGRPIPSRRMNPKIALIFAFSTLGAVLFIIWIFFNPICFTVSAISLTLGCLYSAYLRDKVGYLVLPPIQSMLWLCGWTAFSPDTLFTSWIPWSLYLFSVAWQAGHIMIYSPLHPVSKKHGLKLTQVPALFVRTSPQAASILGFVFLWVALGLGIFLAFFVDLDLIYLIAICIMGAIMLIMSYKFMKDSENFSKGIKAFQAITYFMLTARVFMLLSII